MPDLQALVVDYGGVLTSSLQECMQAWCDTDDVEPEEFQSAMREWLGPSYAEEARVNPVHALERGELTVPEFERALATRLRTRSGRPLAAEGLLGRMFAGFARESTMTGVVRQVRRSGLRTALLSNSWGMDYPRHDWEELFHAVVISGEVGMRKPEPRIYLHVASVLGVPPQRCVFVDDLAANVRGAAEVGMVGVHHRNAPETVRELEALFGMRLGPDDAVA